MGGELYANGGATDVRSLPADTGFGALTLSIPGSQMWQRLTFDKHGRLHDQLIINPGHRIERSFTYPPPEPAAP